MTAGERVQLGISVSNCADSMNPGSHLPDRLQLVIDTLSPTLGVEIQLEGAALSFPIPPLERSAIPFLGVHLPISGIDFLNPSQEVASMAQTRSALQIAKHVQAEYVVSHLQTTPEWDRIGDREEVNVSCRGVITKILDAAQAVGFAGEVYFENLEFPLFPATADEIRQMATWVVEEGQKRGIRTGIALDIAHLWHNGGMGGLIPINSWKGDVMRQYLDDPYASGAMTFRDYLRSLLEDIGPFMRLIHMTGAHEHETHLLPSESTLRGDDDMSLRLEESLRDVLDILGRNGQKVSIVNEAHGSPYAAMRESTQLVRRRLSI